MNNNNEVDLLDKATNLTANSFSLAMDELGGDKEVPVFFLEWLKNGFNATAAYKALHPDVTNESARVLGSRKLAKVNIGAILVASGYDYTDFVGQLKAGLNATRWNEFTREQVPDHRVRLEYMKLLIQLWSAKD